MCNIFKKATHLRANAQAGCQRTEAEEDEEGKKGERSEVGAKTTLESKLKFPRLLPHCLRLHPVRYLKGVVET